MLFSKPFENKLETSCPLPLNISVSISWEQVILSHNASNFMIIRLKEQDMLLLKLTVYIVILYISTLT